MRFKSTRTLLAVAATVFAALCATALADFTVYDNDFSSRAEFKQIIKSGSAKKCDRRFREKSKSMLASVKRGKTTCTFRPPVEGDDELPNQTVRVDGKILKKTPKSVRGGAFLELTLRSGGGGVGYTLRVFPQKQRFELLRGPAGNGFPQQGDSDAIKKINKRNSLSLDGPRRQGRGVHQRQAGRRGRRREPRSGQRHEDPLLGRQRQAEEQGRRGDLQARLGRGSLSRRRSGPRR